MLGSRLSASVLLYWGMVLAVNPSAIAPISASLSPSASHTSASVLNNAPTTTLAQSLGTLAGGGVGRSSSSSGGGIDLPILSCAIDACGIDYLSGSVLWWPEATTTHDSAAPPATTVFSGKTLTSPTVYLAYHGINLTISGLPISLPFPTLPTVTLGSVTLGTGLSSDITSSASLLPRATSSDGGDVLSGIGGITLPLPGGSSCTVAATLFSSSGLVPFASQSISQFLVPTQHMTLGFIAANELPIMSKVEAPLIYSNLANCTGVIENESLVTQTVSGTVAVGDRCYPRLVVPKEVAPAVGNWKRCGGGLWEIHDPPRPLHAEPVKNSATVSAESPPAKPTPHKPKPSHQPGTAVSTSSSRSPTAPAGAPGSAGGGGGGGTGSTGGTGGTDGSGSNNNGGSSSSSSGSGDSGNSGSSNNNGGGGSSGSSNSHDGDGSGSGSSGGGGNDVGAGSGSINGGGQSSDGDQSPSPGQDPPKPAASGLAIGSLPITIAAAGPTGSMELIGPSMTVTAGGAAMTIGGSMVSLGSSELVVGSQTVTAGGAAVTIGGSVVSLGSSVLVVGSQTETFGSQGYAMPTVATGAGAKTLVCARNLAIGLWIGWTMSILV